MCVRVNLAWGRAPAFVYHRAALHPAGSMAGARAGGPLAGGGALLPPPKTPPPPPGNMKPQFHPPPPAPTSPAEESRGGTRSRPGQGVLGGHTVSALCVAHGAPKSRGETPTHPPTHPTAAQRKAVAVAATAWGTVQPRKRPIATLGRMRPAGPVVCP